MNLAQRAGLTKNDYTKYKIEFIPPKLIRSPCDHRSNSLHGIIFAYKISKKTLKSNIIGRIKLVSYELKATKSHARTTPFLQFFKKKKKKYEQITVSNLNTLHC